MNHALSAMFAGLSFSAALGGRGIRIDAVSECDHVPSQGRFYEHHIRVY